MIVKRLFLFAIMLCFAKLSFGQATLDVVSYGGAIPDDDLDDRVAIQKTIDAVNTAGGGTVTFPAGTFMVSKVDDPSPIQVICLQIYSNIILKGAGRSISMIKLMPDIGNFDAMISCKPSWETITNFQLLDLTVDENGGNNSTPTQTILNTNGSRSVFRLFLGKRINIENCGFTNIKGVWGLVFNGIIDTVVVNNNIFSNIGDAFIDWDHSTIYSTGDNFTITNNQISSLNGAVTLGARTGIEIHGGHQYIANNIIRGMTGGMNVTGFSNFGYLSENQTYYHNTITDALVGFYLWSGVGDDPSITVGLKNVLFEDNTIQLNPEAWVNWQYFNSGAGFYFEQGESNRDTKNVYFIRNKVNFKGSSNIAYSNYASGFSKSKSNFAVKLSECYVLNNIFENSFGPGVFLNDDIQNSVFSKNKLINCGSSVSSISNDLRSGFYLGDKLTNIQICNNAVNDNQSAATLKNIVANTSQNAGNCFRFNNVSNVQDANEFLNKGTGEPWISELAKPALSFNLDSLEIPRGGSSSVLQLILSQVSDVPITASIIFRDFNTTQSAAVSLPDTAFVFAPGETSKSVTVNAENNTSDEGRIYAELIVSYTDDAFSGSMQHCKIIVPSLNNDNSAPSVPSGLEPSDIEMNSFRVSWNPSSDDFAVTGYDIYLDGILYAATNMDTSVLITGLKPAISYHINVIAKDRAENYSALSAVLTVTTLIDNIAPSIPAGLNSQFITEVGFLLKWTASTDNDAISGYEVYKDGIFFDFTTALRLNISGLNSGTSYSMTVRAKDVAGNASDPSSPLIVKTTGIATSVESASSSGWGIVMTPNPLSGEWLNVSLKNIPNNEDVFVSILDLKGTEFFKSNMYNSRNFNIPAGSCGTGIYLVRIICGVNVVSKKILIEK